MVDAECVKQPDLEDLYLKKKKYNTIEPIQRDEGYVLNC